MSRRVNGGRLSQRYTRRERHAMLLLGQLASLVTRECQIVLRVESVSHFICHDVL